MAKRITMRLTAGRLFGESRTALQYVSCGLCCVACGQAARHWVLDWRQRFAEGGVKALYDDRPRGRSFKPLARAKEAGIITRTQGAPPQATQWSCSSMAKVCGVSKASVQRVWHANGLKPHLLKTFKLSNDPDSIEKLEDVAGLYMNPPEHALVFCIDDPSASSG